MFCSRRGSAAFKKFYKNGSLADKPWTPQVLPLQLIILGDHAFAGVPGEVTTIAGRRIEKTLLEILATRGVVEVVVASYCNGYCGYICTYEEYEAQAYEGGHTVFGKHTLGAMLTRFRQMALELLKPDDLRSNLSDGVPLEFSEEELALRSFDGKARGK
jgi:neutral ceramidase